MEKGTDVSRLGKLILSNRHTFNRLVKNNTLPQYVVNIEINPLQNEIAQKAIANMDERNFSYLSRIIEDFSEKHIMNINHYFFAGDKLKYSRSPDTVFNNEMEWDLFFKISRIVPNYRIEVEKADFFEPFLSEKYEKDLKYLINNPLDKSRGKIGKLETDFQGQKLILDVFLNSLDIKEWE